MNSLPCVPICPLINPLLMIVNKFKTVNMPLGLCAIHYLMHFVRYLLIDHMIKLNNCCLFIISHSPWCFFFLYQTLVLYRSDLTGPLSGNHCLFDAGQFPLLFPHYSLHSFKQPLSIFFDFFKAFDWLLHFLSSSSIFSISKSTCSSSFVRLVIWIKNWLSCFFLWSWENRYDSLMMRWISQKRSFLSNCLSFI